MQVPKKLAVLAVALLAVGAGTARADSLDSEVAGLLEGRVSSADAPLPASVVYAYQLADLSLRKVATDERGNFLFERLPAGLYQVIAFKSGFAPTVALLTRASASARQFLDLQLEEERAVESAGRGYWSLRERLPGDVLRDIDRMAAAERGGSVALGDSLASAQFEAEMRAVAGIDDRAWGSAQRAGGRVGVRGEIRDVSIDLSGDFLELDSASRAGGFDPASGRTQLLSLAVENGSTSGVQVTSLNNHLETRTEGRPAFVDFERHRVSWTQNLGAAGRSDFAAQYTEQNNFYVRGPIVPLGLPHASRSWRLEGSYTASPSARSTVHAGFRYRERRSEYQEAAWRLDAALLPEETVDLFGRGGLQVKPALLVEFGLYSTLRDGSLSLAPSGGVVVQLGENWRAFSSASLTAHEQEMDVLRQEFTPVFFDETDGCERVDDYCYRVELAHYTGDRENLSFGATNRRFADTQQLYFTEDFFSDVESLYLVRGDSLPELEFVLTRRLSPTVLTRLESSVAAGGGGVLYATTESSYENSVQYLVTSLDTQFEQTSTGVFLAFHHLAQQLDPIQESYLGEGPGMELKRLQLMLTQDLDFLQRLASDWILHLNMEVSRGSGSSEGAKAHVDEWDLRKRIMGGLAVKF